MRFTSILRERADHTKSMRLSLPQKLALPTPHTTCHSDAPQKKQACTYTHIHSTSEAALFSQLHTQSTSSHACLLLLLFATEKKPRAGVYYTMCMCTSVRVFMRVRRYFGTFSLLPKTPFTGARAGRPQATAALTKAVAAAAFDRIKGSNSFSQTICTQREIQAEFRRSGIWREGEGERDSRGLERERERTKKAISIVQGPTHASPQPRYTQRG